MAASAPSSPHRARSRDGTGIAWWSSGTGPSLVVVHGTPADHTRWTPLLPYLEPHCTVHALDRRGRGASGDGAEYHVEREYEDVAAVVDAIAADTGGRVHLYGHSHGGFVAFGAAARSDHVGRVVLYEGWPAPDPERYAIAPELEERLDALLAGGERSRLIEELFRRTELMSDDELDAFKRAPSWPGRVAAAHTVTREIRGEAGARLDPAEAAAVTAPVLLLVGEHSNDPAKGCADAVADVLPDATVAVLPGQGHVGDVLDAEAFAARLLAFLGVALSGP